MADVSVVPGSRTEDFLRDFAEDPASFLSYSDEEVFAGDPARLDALKLEHARRRVAELAPRIGLVETLRRFAQVEAIEGFEDLLPLMLSQESLRSYPQAWLEANDFTRMTKWLGKLTAKDLRGIDMSGVELIEQWFAVLARDADLEMIITANSDGKASFLPRSIAERKLHRRITYWNWSAVMRDAQGNSVALRPGIDRVPIVHPGTRTGARSWGAFLDFYEEMFGAGLADAPLGHSDADLISLAGRIKAASAKGEAGMLQISPRILGRKAEIAALNQQNARNMAAFIDRMVHQYRGQRILFHGTMQMLYSLAERFRDLGVTGAYHQDSFFFCGGGFAGGVTPPNWQETVTNAFGVPITNIVISYGMIEGIGSMAACRAGHYHVPVTMIPFILDPDSNQPLPRVGVQSGRYAFFDLLARDSWGGFMSADFITVHFDGGCACGRQGAYLGGKIARIADTAGEKIGCGGTAGAVEEATDFIIRA